MIFEVRITIRVLKRANIIYKRWIILIKFDKKTIIFIFKVDWNTVWLRFIEKTAQPMS